MKIALIGSILLGVFYSGIALAENFDRAVCTEDNYFQIQSMEKISYSDGNFTYVDVQNVIAKDFDEDGRPEIYWYEGNDVYRQKTMSNSMYYNPTIIDACYDKCTDKTLLIDVNNDSTPEIFQIINLDEFSVINIGSERFNKPFVNDYVVGDFNKDGFVDIVLATDGEVSKSGKKNKGKIEVFFNGADGVTNEEERFGDSLTLKTFDSISFIEAGDYNGDGKSDIFVMGRTGDSNYYSVLFGKGKKNTFKKAKSYLFEDALDGKIGSLDLNRDGNLDIIAKKNNDLVALFGNGKGTFSKANVILKDVLGDSSKIPVFVDINHDNFIDIFVLRKNYISEYLGTADPTKFNEKKIFLYDVKDFSIADFNADNKEDLIFLRVSGYDYPNFFKLFGDGTGNFTEFEKGIESVQLAQQVLKADFNGDNVDDFVVLSETEYAFLLSADGKVASKKVIFENKNHSSAISVADYNNDGFLDLLIGTELQLGTGTDDLFFASKDLSQYLGIDGVTAPSQVKAADLNNDSVVDVVAFYPEKNLIKAFLGSSNGTFKESFVIDNTCGDIGENKLVSFSVEDFNLDGKLDLNVRYAKDNYTNMNNFIGNGSGTFIYEPAEYCTDFLRVGPASLEKSISYSKNGRRYLMFSDNIGNGDALSISCLKCDEKYCDESLSAYFAHDKQVSKMINVDINHDGMDDIITLNDDLTVSLLIGQADDGFITKTYDGVFGMVDAVTSDINQDGVDEILVLRGDSGELIDVTNNKSFVCNVKQQDEEIIKLSAPIVLNVKGKKNAKIIKMDKFDASKVYNPVSKSQKIVTIYEIGLFKKRKLSYFETKNPKLKLNGLKAGKYSVFYDVKVKSKNKIRYVSNWSEEKTFTIK